MRRKHWVTLLAAICLAVAAMMVVDIVKNPKLADDEVRIVYRPGLYRREMTAENGNPSGRTNVTHRFFWDVTVGGKPNGSLDFWIYKNGMRSGSQDWPYPGTFRIGIALTEPAGSETRDAAKKWPSMTARQTVRRGERVLLLVKEKGVPAWSSAVEVKRGSGNYSASGGRPRPNQMERMELAIYVTDNTPEKFPNRPPGIMAKGDALMRLETVTGPTDDAPDPR